MVDFAALKAKIVSLKNEIVQDSISPVRLGTILEELLQQMREIYQVNLGDDIQQAIIDANNALDRANKALEILEIAINMHLEAAGVTIVDRGTWHPGENYYFAELNPVTGVVETSDVWYHGCRWRCLITGTTQEPRWDATDWMFIEGNPDFTVEFEPVNTVFRVTAIDMTLNIVAWLHNQNITDDIHASDVVWTRYSEDAEGTPRLLSDSVWAHNHIGAGKSVHITTADIDWNGGPLPKKIRFTATVTLRDGEEAAAAMNLIDMN